MASASTNPHQKTKHHLYPTSRCKIKEVKGRKNLRVVERRFHEAWHSLFYNMTPFEIVAGIIRLWAPEGYFTKAKIVAEWEDCQYEFILDGPLDFQSERILACYENSVLKKKHLWHVLFRNKSFLDVISEVVNVWAPPDFFELVEVEAKEKNQVLKFSYEKKQLS